MLPSELRWPLVFKSSCAATPWQTTRTRQVAGITLPTWFLITFFGKPRLQMQFALRPTGRQYVVGTRSPFSFFGCQWCCTRLKIRSATGSKTRRRAISSSAATTCGNGAPRRPIWAQDGPRGRPDCPIALQEAPRRAKKPPRRYRKPPRGLPRRPREAKIVNFPLVFQ